MLTPMQRKVVDFLVMERFERFDLRGKPHYYYGHDICQLTNRCPTVLEEMTDEECRLVLHCWEETRLRKEGRWGHILANALDE